MSADNYAICPRCRDNAKRENAELFRRMVASYGKVPAAEYERIRSETQSPFDEEAFRTFREDYEFFGASSGTVTASYGGSCETCGLSVSFQYEHPFYESVVTA